MAPQPDPAGEASLSAADRRRSLPVAVARGMIRAYQLTLSAFFGRTCRHMPTCSEYADEAIARHGVWAGGWMVLARLWRCRPFGSHGYDAVPDALPAGSLWYTPWRYGRWRSNF